MFLRLETLSAIRRMHNEKWIDRLARLIFQRFCSLFYIHFESSLLIDIIQLNLFFSILMTLIKWIVDKHSQFILTFEIIKCYRIIIIKSILFYIYIGKFPSVNETLNFKIKCAIIFIKDKSIY